MNAVFHTSLALATSVLFAGGIKRPEGKESLMRKNDAGILIGGFAANIALHGLLDWAPHVYPVDSIYDILVSSFMIFILLILVRTPYMITVLACAFGAVFPDLVDLAAPSLNKYLGINLPVYKIFPWHAGEFAEYKSADPRLSILNTMIVLAVITAIVLIRRKFIREKMI